MKKSIIFMLVIAITFTISACGSSNSDAGETSAVAVTQSSVASVSAPEQAEPEEFPKAEEVVTSTQENQPEPIVLSWDEEGEYGKETTLNANTDMPYTFIEFHIPIGTYQVINNGESSVQVSINNDGTVITEEGWEDPIADAGNNVVLMPGDEGELTIKEGQYVKLTDHSDNIYFVRTGD